MKMRKEPFSKSSKIQQILYTKFGNTIVIDGFQCYNTHNKGIYALRNHCLFYDNENYFERTDFYDKHEAKTDNQAQAHQPRSP